MKRADSLYPLPNSTNVNVGDYVFFPRFGGYLLFPITKVADFSLIARVSDVIVTHPYNFHDLIVVKKDGQILVGDHVSEANRGILSNNQRNLETDLNLSLAEK